MKLSIYTIQSTLFDGEVEKIIARTSTGEITVLDGHIPLMSVLKGPTVEVAGKNSERKTISLSSGFLEVRPGSKVVILANQ